MRITGILIITTFFLCCKTQKTNNSLTNDELAIISKVTAIQKFKEAKLSTLSLNKRLWNDLSQNIRFQEGKYEEFGELRNGIFSDNIIDNVFTKKEVEILKSQLNEDYKWNGSNKNSSDLTYSLSKPAFTSNRTYALVMYSYGNKLYEIGGSGVMLFKKQNGEWVYIGEFWGTMS